MNGKRFAVLAGFAAVIVAFVGMLGCEHATQTSSTDANVIVFDPPLATISGAYAGVAFSVSSPSGSASASSTSTNRGLTLYLPLVWSVDNPSLGEILASEGFTAAYRSFGGIGEQIVRCHDQQGSAGMAVVVQRPVVTSTN